MKLKFGQTAVIRLECGDGLYNLYGLIFRMQAQCMYLSTLETILKFNSGNLCGNFDKMFT